MQRQFDGQVEIIGVAGRDDLGEMQAFVNDTGASGFEHIADSSGDVWAQYGVTSQPAFVFINDDGTTELLVSALGQETLTERVEALIAT